MKNKKNPRDIYTNNRILKEGYIMCKFYVIKEASRVATNGEVRVTYDPTKALMVCDDIVAANKYFEFCVSKRSGRYVLFADSVTTPCRLAELSAKLNKGKVMSGNSGFQMVRDTSLYKNQQSGKYEIHEVSSRWLVSENNEEKIMPINMFDFYSNMTLPCKRGYRIEGMIMTHCGPHGVEKRIHKLRHGIQGIMRPFEMLYRVDPV